MPYVEKLSGSARSVVFSGKSGSDLVSVFSGDGKKPYDNHRGRQHHDARGLGDRAHRQPRVERDTDRCPVRQGDLGEAQCIQEIVRHGSSRYVRNRIQEEPPTVTPEGGIVKRVEIASSAEYSPCVIRGYERRTSERHFRGIQNLNSTHIIRDTIRSNCWCCKIDLSRIESHQSRLLHARRAAPRDCAVEAEPKSNPGGLTRTAVECHILPTRQGRALIRGLPSRTRLAICSRVSLEEGGPIQAGDRTGR